MFITNQTVHKLNKILGKRTIPFLVALVRTILVYSEGFLHLLNRVIYLFKANKR